jgi:uncharacterized membrane protein (UPF0127 family)
MIRWSALLTLLLALCLSAFTGASPADAAGLQSIAIATPSGTHVFSVEIAATRQERARGLMFRKELPQNNGMLFDFGRDQDVTMWMQNTYIPLDMIFIRADGTILRVAENNQPRSTKLIPSGGAVRAVLELRAGTARKLGITAGDMVEHLPFSQSLEPGKR